MPSCPCRSSFKSDRAGLRGYGSPERRRDSSIAEMMLATTLTSCAAFLATALLSPMAAMRCLGFITFASLLFDYLLVLSLYAACLVLSSFLFRI